MRAQLSWAVLLLHVEPVGATPTKTASSRPHPALICGGGNSRGRSAWPGLPFQAPRPRPMQGARGAPHSVVSSEASRFSCGSWLSGAKKWAVIRAPHSAGGSESKASPDVRCGRCAQVCEWGWGGVWPAGSYLCKLPSAGEGMLFYFEGCAPIRVHVSKDREEVKGPAMRTSGR